MLSHLLLGSNNPAASRPFYDAVLGVLGAAPSVNVHVNGFDRLIWDHDGLRLMVAIPRNGEACMPYNGFTLGLKTTSIAQLHAALDAALAHGGAAIEDPPGWRRAPDNDRYLAYVHDPDGHKLCLIFREAWAQPDVQGAQGAAA